MISHLSIGVSNLSRATAFYDAVLAGLGYVRIFSGPTSVGYGPPGGPEGLALKERPSSAIGVDEGFHLAFVASDHAAVDRFYEAAVALGGAGDGAAGLRPEYGPRYYAAFVVDHDGHRLEAVCEQA
ncbi:MAG TPA: VOC family protein [Caulobacteraceae bacterium]|nr:VOC family protein [Caulobacteraceae bacterium]